LIVSGTLAIQLRNVLQMTTADDDLMALRSSDIGLDSLISVDIRSWFLKNFEVSVPVLKIMGNDTIADLAELVAGQVPPNLLPEISAGEAPASNEEAVTTNATLQPAPAIKERNSSDNTSSSTDDSHGYTSAESNDGGTGLSTPEKCVSKGRNGTLQKQSGQTDWDTEITLSEAEKIATNKALLAP